MTAKSLSLNVPQTLLVAANEVMEWEFLLQCICPLRH